jgi:hypothetical protein
VVSSLMATAMPTPGSTSRQLRLSIDDLFHPSPQQWKTA